MPVHMHMSMHMHMRMLIHMPMDMDMHMRIDMPMDHMDINIHHACSSVHLPVVALPTMHLHCPVPENSIRRSMHHDVHQKMGTRTVNPRCRTGRCL